MLTLDENDLYGNNLDGTSLMATTLMLIILIDCNNPDGNNLGGQNDLYGNNLDGNNYGDIGVDRIAGAETRVASA